MRAAHIAPKGDDYGLVGNVRAEMGRSRVTASALARTYGGAVSYWTRRANGELPMSAADVERIAEACGVHPAQLFGGRAPAGWLPRRDSNLEPSDYRTLSSRRVRSLGVAA